MLKGHWHLLALATLTSILTLKTNSLVYFLLFISWLLYLFLWKRYRLFVILLTLFIYFVSFFYLSASLQFKNPSVPSELLNLKTFTSGVVKSPLKENERKIEFTFYSDQLKENIVVILFKNDHHQTNNNDEYSHIRYNARCEIYGKLEQPSQATNPYQFDYGKYLKDNGIIAQLIISSPEDLTCMKTSSPIDRIYSFRETVIEWIEKKFTKEFTSWQQALIFGNRTLLNEETTELFQRWGLAHILAISGLHVGIVVAIVYYICLHLFSFTKENSKLLLLLFLPIYAFIAGGEPSVWRACLMTSAVIILTSFKIKIAYTDLLSIIFLSLIAMDPTIIHHIGFQFSFAVTFGLLLSKNWITQTHNRFYQLLKISFISQMVIVPLQMFYFYQFQPLSILLNVLILPYFSLFVIPVMFISLFLVIAPSMITTLIERAFLFVHRFIIKGIQWMDDYLDYAFISGDITSPIVISYYIIIVFMMIYLEKQEELKAFMAGIGLSFVLTFILLKPYLDPTGNVTMLDIGQGDAFIVELPYRKGVFLFDVGSSFTYEDMEPTDRVYENIIKKYLMGRGIYQIDTIFLSHHHVDHYGSINFLIKQFPVQEIVIHRYNGASVETLEEWEKHNVQITKAFFNDKLVRKNHVFHVLYPYYDKQDENENSLVIYTMFGGKKWLFTGDIEKEGELGLMQKYEQLPVDFLKVAHHGSLSSSMESFINWINPSYAFIPVGRNNRYNHPSKEVIERFQQKQIHIYRTDQQGAVQFYFNERKGTYRIEPFLK